MKNYQKAVVISVTAIYIVLGGVVIHYCEMNEEAEVRQQLNDTIREFLANNSGVNVDDVKTLLAEVISARNYGIDPVWPDANTPVRTTWDFYSSMFFAATVVTTIGFGNLVPRTNAGRTFIVFFALIGIEIAAATVAIVSTVQLVGIDKGLTRLMLPKDASDDDKKQLTKRPKFRTARILLNFFIMSFFFAAIPSLIFTKMEGWTYSTALYFTFVTMTTVGFGDYVAGAFSTYREWYRLCVAGWILMSLSSCSAFISTVRDSFWLFGGEDDSEDPEVEPADKDDRPPSANEDDVISKTTPADENVDVDGPKAALAKWVLCAGCCCVHRKAQIAPVQSGVDLKSRASMNDGSVAGSLCIVDGEIDLNIVQQKSNAKLQPNERQMQQPQLLNVSKTELSSRADLSDVTLPQSDSSKTDLSTS